jgi:hypothetical protein
MKTTFCQGDKNFLVLFLIFLLSFRMTMSRRVIQITNYNNNNNLPQQNSNSLNNAKPNNIDIDNFSKISQNELLKIINHSNLKILKVKPVIIFVDDYFPLKYVKKFFDSMIENYTPIKLPTGSEAINLGNTSLNTIQINKILILCKAQTKENEQHQLIPKLPFREMEKILREINNKDENQIKRSILDLIIPQLEILSKSMKKTCKGVNEYVSQIKDSLSNSLINNNSQNIKKKDNISEFVDNNFRGLISELTNSLKLNNFTNSGKWFGKLLTYFSN